MCGWSNPLPCRFSTEELTRYLRQRMLVGPWCRSGQVQKISLTPGLDPRTNLKYMQHRKFLGDSTLWQGLMRVLTFTLTIKYVSWYDCRAKHELMRLLLLLLPPPPPPPPLLILLLLYYILGFNPFYRPRRRLG